MLALTLGRQIQRKKVRNREIFSILYSILCVLSILPSLVLSLLAATVSAETEEKKDGKALSVFNVVREVIIKKKHFDMNSEDIGRNPLIYFSR